jgi:soluble lytic murein transglycosylase-like protein
MALQKSKTTSQRATKPTVRRAPIRKGKMPPKRGQQASKKFVAYLLIELVSLTLSALIWTISMLGRAANWFGGSDLAQSLIPFAGSVVLLVVVGSLFLAGWFVFRQRIRRFATSGAAILALALLVLSIVYAGFPQFKSDVARLRSLVGGVAQAGQDSIAHQVYAAYRRSNLDDMALILSRVGPYETDIQKAAELYHLNPEVLVGIGITESSFLPRDSKDGGKGLFQITAVPKSVSRDVSKRLGIEAPDPRVARENIYLAAATFAHYLAEMKGDLFLGLLAYNIGPRNGGLTSIMAQYGARDFFTIQPYLKDLPRDYPIRVLSASLAFRLNHEMGGLPRYEEGRNAQVIQAAGIPGLDLWSPELLPSASSQTEGAVRR